MRWKSTKSLQNHDPASILQDIQFLPTSASIWTRMQLWLWRKISRHPRSTTGRSIWTVVPPAHHFLLNRFMLIVTSWIRSGPRVHGMQLASSIKRSGNLWTLCEKGSLKSELKQCMSLLFTSFLPLPVVSLDRFPGKSSSPQLLHTCDQSFEKVFAAIRSAHGRPVHPTWP